MNKIKFDLRPWYIGHIIGLVGIAFIGGHYLQDWLCSKGVICIEQFTPTSTMIIANLIFYSILAWLYDTTFHSVTGLD
jgi:hypothetical protein